jgi:hypothetical protein
MAGFLHKLEKADGKPAEPSSFSSAVPNWAPVVEVRGDDDDEPWVLVVEDVA